MCVCVCVSTTGILQVTECTSLAELSGALRPDVNFTYHLTSQVAPVSCRQPETAVGAPLIWLGYLYDLAHSADITAITASGAGVLHECMVSQCAADDDLTLFRISLSIYHN